MSDSSMFIKHLDARLRVAADGVRLEFSCPDGGHGSITHYELFSGVGLESLDISSRSQGRIPGLLRGEGTNSVVYSARGSYRISAGDKVYELGEKELLRFYNQADNQIHAFNSGHFVGLILNIEASKMGSETRRALDNFDVDLRLLDFSRAPWAQEPAGPPTPELSHIISELSDMLPHAHLGTVRLKAIEFLQQLCRETEEKVARVGAAHPSKRANHLHLAYQAQQLMEANLSSPLTIASLAQACDTSPTVLKEAFREAFGVPIYSWYRTYRCRKAAELMLTTNQSIAQIARTVGYVNPSKFTKAFKDCMGAGPRAWRKAHQHSESHQHRNE